MSAPGTLTAVPEREAPGFLRGVARQIVNVTPVQLPGFIC